MKYLFALLVGLFCGTAVATQQSPEVLLSPTGVRAMLADPISSLQGANPQAWSRLVARLPDRLCSAISRGYMGTWDIERGHLRLVSLRAVTCEGSNDIPLNALFPGTDGPVQANWFSGELLFELGPRVQGPCGFSATCPSAFNVMTVKNGKIVKNEERPFKQ